MSSPPARRPPARKPLPQPWWRGPLPILLPLAGIVLIVAVLFYMSARGSGSPAPAPSPQDSAQVTGQVTGVSPQVLDAVGAGGLKSPLRAAPHPTQLTGPGGQPEVLYIGAEYCPFCAAERWSLVIALSRFGTLSGLRLTSSSGSDIYPNTPTFSFVASSYRSSSLEFVSVELENRDRAPLQTATADEQRILNANDSQGSIPFIDIGGSYVGIGAGYQPDVLAGKSATQVASALADPSSPITKAIVGNANYLTAAICKGTSGQPASVCGDPLIQGLAAQLP